VRLVALQWRSSLRGCVRVVLEPQSRERFPAVQPRRCDGIDSDHTDGCWLRRCRGVSYNAGLCGPVVSLSSGQTYYTGGTALGSTCPTVTSAPTSSPTSSSPSFAPSASPSEAGEIGSCYQMTSTPISSSIASGSFTSAGCFAKGTHLPTWMVNGSVCKAMIQHPSGRSPGEPILESCGLRTPTPCARRLPAAPFHT
jgi:hypothetical protein